MNPTPVTKKTGAEQASASPAAEPTAGRGAQATPASQGTSAARRSGLVALVGAGPGDEGLLTVRAAALLARADLIVAAPWVSGRLAHLMPAEATVVDSATLDDDPRLMIKAAKSGQTVVRLFTGDPFLFCGAASEAAACARAKVPFEIVPGLPAATAVPAYSGIPLTPDVTGDVRIVHAAEVSQVSATSGTLVILGAETGVTDIAKMLVAAGWPDSAPLGIIWNGTTTEQYTVTGTLGTAAADLKAAGVSPLTAQGRAIAVVGDGVRSQAALSWFETKPLFGWRGLGPPTKEQAAAGSERGFLASRARAMPLASSSSPTRSERTRSTRWRAVMLRWGRCCSMSSSMG